MLRKQTSTYVHNKVDELVAFLTNGTGVLAGLIDVSSLKFKERDAIEKAKILKSPLYSDLIQ